jgi:hypothetical protein
VVRGLLGVRDAYPGGQRLFRKLNNFSEQINKVDIRKKAKSEIGYFKNAHIINLPIKIKIPFFVYFSFVNK